MRLTRWIEFLISVLVGTVSFSQGVPTTNQPQYAKSIDDLCLVLGTNYKLFVAAYWRYLINTCEFVSDKLSDDLVSGYLDKWKTCSYGQVIPTRKLFGGYEATEGEFPWTSMLLMDGKFLCGCVIVDTTHVITAAHCFDSQVRSSKYEIFAGRYAYNLSVAEAGGQRISVKSFTTHEEYKRDPIKNDLAIVTLARPLLVTSSVTPACLPSANDTPEKYCTVAGWGLTNSRKPPDVLMKVRLETYNYVSCLDTFRNTAQPPGYLDKLLNDRVICAANGTFGGQDSCQGDSGGPLMCLKQTTYGPRYFVFGLVSNGNSCATPGEPGLYTNLVRYLDWIHEKSALN